MPPDPAGMIEIVSMQHTPDAASYAYSYHRILSDLSPLLAGRRPPHRLILAGDWNLRAVGAGAFESSAGLFYRLQRNPSFLARDWNLRTVGAGLFQRGETQVLTVATLGDLQGHTDGRRTAHSKCANRFHDLRHTAATMLLTQGVHPKVVSEMLGHATITLTLDTYSHLWPDSEDRTRDAIDAVLGAPADSVRTERS